MVMSTNRAFSSAIIGSSTALNQKSRLSQFSEYREERYFANVWVQLFLYVNVYFCSIWLFNCVITLYLQYTNLSTIHSVLSILSLIIAAPVECLRLYLGYSGNLLDKIPDFAGFWILSVFIQTPLQIYLMTSEQVLKYNISTALQAFQCLLLVLQIITSFGAIRRASRFRREQFQAQTHSFDIGRPERDQTVGSKISIISD